MDPVFRSSFENGLSARGLSMVGAWPGLCLGAFTLSGCVFGVLPEDEEVITASIERSLSDEHNYFLETTLSIEEVQVKSDHNITVDWSQLNQDIQGHSLADTPIEEVALVVFGELSTAELAEGLANDSLQQADVSLYVSCSPAGESSCTLADFGVLGADLEVQDYFLESTGNWLAVLTSDSYRGVHSFMVIQPRDGISNTIARIDNDSSALEATVDLTSITPITLPPNETDVALDWSALTMDGLGNEMDVRTLDQLELARFPLPVEELEAQFFNLDFLSDARWQGDISEGNRFALRDLEGSEPFTGIDEAHTWMLALSCEAATCLHPAPRVIAILEAEAVP